MLSGRRRSPLALSRRNLLARAANGFGALALGALWAEAHGVAASPEQSPLANSLARQSGPDGAALGPRTTHFPPRATNIIFLYMDGGPSQVDTFDPKPRLTKEHGKPFGMKMEPTQFNNIGATLASPWKFKRHGQSGLEVSELFPHVGRQADDLCVVRSMVSNFSEHTNANYFLHTGHGQQGRPSMGAWCGYGLGSESRDLPGFIVLNGGLIPPGGMDCFNSGFLPASYQGSLFNASSAPVANIRRLEASETLQRNKLALLRQLDEAALVRSGHEDALESAIANYELAFRMQSAVPELMDIQRETAATRALYGLDHEWPGTRVFAHQCLVARRLVERGVRFIELTCPGGQGDRWDQHSGLKTGHENNARCVDQPIAGLLTDLKQRGLLDSTLVVWMGEFGRTPFAQGSDGRDHNPFGFSAWLAGGGIRGGVVYGQTDDYGYKAVENKVEIHDLHATMLHLLGLDHKRLTFRFSGRDMRLTDVHGHVVREWLA